jgi:hypothetical protein
MSLFPRFGQRRRHWSLTLLLLFLGLALEPPETEAQSGRRATNPTPPPASSTPPAPSASPEEQKEPSPGKLPTKVRLLVARQPTSKHLQSEDRILASFIKQLNRYENIEATSIGDQKESEAVDRAKTETSAYVILMRFDIDNFKNGTIIINSQDLEVEYFVLAPHTGKRQTKGKVYFQGIGGGMMRKSDWPNGTPIRITPEGAGIEAADGLYLWLKLVATEKK